MTVYVDLSNEQEELEPPCDIEELTKRIAAAAFEIENIEDDAEISVTLCDNEYIRKLNSEYRGIDRETDVLSFPMCDEERGFETDPDNGALLLGDIVISLPKAKAQSEEYGHSFERETAFLIAHSLLHLLGHDHIEPNEEKKMFEKQEQILNKLGITR